MSKYLNKRLGRDKRQNLTTLKAMKKFILLTALLGLTMTAEAQAAPKLMMETSKGPVEITLMPEVAPKHVERLVTLTKEGFYDGIIFHRVISGFMAQTGDPSGTGMGGSKLGDLPAEFNNENFERGVVGMARSASPNSANSQFFICFADCSFLNGQYTVFGKVTAGMENVDKIEKGEPPANPDKIVKMTVAE
jgi:peptidylprolyl isomerase